MVSGWRRPGEGADQQGDHTIKTSRLHAAKVHDIHRHAIIMTYYHLIDLVNIITVYLKADVSQYI